MKMLDQFEHAIEQVVEGGVGRLFRAPVRPALIARRIETAMAAGVEVNRDLVVAPNYLLVNMHPADVSRISGYLTPLGQQLEYGAEQYARQSGWTLLDRVRAEMVPAAAVERGDALIEATIQAKHVNNEPPARLLIQGACRLLIVNGPEGGQEFTVRPGSTLVGRDRGCGITLTGDDISRHHARIDFGGAGVVVTDLQSTNGTRRNGDPIVRAFIAPGDAVRFGSVSTRFLAIEAAPPNSAA